jgi:hypothetical protein
MSLCDDLLGYNDLRTLEVEVPQWKTTLLIQELGLEESMLAFGNVKPNEDGEVKLTHQEIAQIVAFGVVDPETKERVFPDSAVKKLARKNRDALMVLYLAITTLSGSVEDEVKN